MRPWSTLNTWSKFVQKEGIFFRIDYEIRGRRYQKQQIYSYNFKGLVCMTTDKTKINTYEEKAIKFV